MTDFTWAITLAVFDDSPFLKRTIRSRFRAKIWKRQSTNSLGLPGTMNLIASRHPALQFEDFKTEMVILTIGPQIPKESNPYLSSRPGAMIFHALYHPFTWVSQKPVCERPELFKHCDPSRNSSLSISHFSYLILPLFILT